MARIPVGLVGVTGYTGMELTRVLAGHPGLTLVRATSRSEAGKALRSLYPFLAGPGDLGRMGALTVTLPDPEEIAKDCKLAFLAVPHKTAQEIAAQLIRRGVKVVDLSADFRLRDRTTYEQWYATPHTQADLLAEAVYGLPELYRAQMQRARLIANPGCYATATLLGIAPLVRAGQLIAGAPVIVDAKSGTSGAGRKPKQNLLFGEVQGNFSPYSIGRTHRHISEIEQQLALDGFQTGQLVFTPHLLPTDRGILAAIYAQVLDAEACTESFRQAYAGEPLLRVLPQGQLATLAHVVRTPWAAISLTVVNKNMLIVMVAIDNLLKGASSQAVQNFNLMFGLPETTGLQEWETTL